MEFNMDFCLVTPAQDNMNALLCATSSKDWSTKDIMQVYGISVTSLWIIPRYI